MIISHKHRFIFFAVPKTATHAIRQALREHMGDEDWEQQVLFGKQSLPIPALAQLQHGHISAQQLQPYLDADQWRDYFKFGFVRNPFDRYVSTCFFLNRQNPAFAEKAIPFMKQALGVPRFRARILVQPQVKQLVAEDGEIALDYVGRYESLQDSFDHICKTIGLPVADLARKNTSKHASYTEYYDEELRQTVARFYADDLQQFDYEFVPA